MRRVLFGTLIVLVAACFSAGTATGGSESTSMQIAATVEAAVQVSATNLDFGTMIPGASATGEATITVTATNLLNYGIHLTAGLHGSDVPGSCSRSMMAGAAEYLPYELYKDSGHMSAWGGVYYPDYVPVYGIGTGLSQDYTVYGQAIAEAATVAGAYTDTVDVVVLF